MTDEPFIDPGPDVYAEGFRRGMYSWMEDNFVLTQQCIEDGMHRAITEWLDACGAKLLHEAIIEALRERS